MAQQEVTVLALTEEQKKEMIESLIINGFCTYDFKILGKYPVVLKSLTFDEQKQLTTALSKINVEDTSAEGIKRNISTPEFNNMATDLSLKAYLVSFNGNKEVDISKLSNSVIKIISDEIRAFITTLDLILTASEEIKN